MLRIATILLTSASDPVGGVDLALSAPVIHQEQPARPRCGCWTATWFAGIFPHTGTGLPSDSHRHGAFAAIASQVTRER